MESAVLRIDSLAAGGDGVGRGDDGRVVFVPFTAPGDLVRVRIERSRRRHAVGRLEELLEPGPARVSPRCRVFGSCGGCAWQHLSYPAQLEAKAGILEDALTRIGGLAWSGEVRVAGSPSPYGYRSRTRVLFESGKAGYRERRSHTLCATSSCPVLLPELDRLLGELAENPPGPDGEWELAGAEGRVRAAPVGGPGGERLFLTVQGERIGFSAGVFAQSNALLVDALVARVLEAAGDGDLLLELYAGAGLLTLPLARRFARVVAVEASPAAVSDLRANLREAGLASVEVLPRRVEAAAGELAGLRPEVLVLDPPRTGLPREAPGLLAGLGARRIVYVSCDPATLARDLRALCEGGYRLDGIEGFDLFPQTAHVEALAALELESRQGGRLGESADAQRPQRQR